MQYLRLWIALAVVMLVSFGVLGYYGWDIYNQAPPIFKDVITTDGRVVFTRKDIQDGQNIWQSMGGQEVGSVWGHGSYVAPDWTADWIHREAEFYLNTWATQQYGVKDYRTLTPEQLGGLKARLITLMKTNTYNPETQTLTLSPVRAQAIQQVGSHYAALFGNEKSPAFAELRDAYAIPANKVPKLENQRKLNAFFFWGAWAASTNRPNQNVTYTQNWPPEPLIDNQPTGSAVVWSVISFVLLLAGVGGLAWYYAVNRRHHDSNGDIQISNTDPLLALHPTPSMKATLKYFWVVMALIVAQVGLGGVTAHYGVEGTAFYGIPIAEWLPYAITRTWHTQLAIFWIATAWLATGLFVAPAISGYEPPFQRAGVNFLFVCLLIIVVGSLAGEWLAVQNHLGLTQSFWFGHQGYEYVDLGRFWQGFLAVGLFLWLGLVWRAIKPAFKTVGESKHLLGLFVLASAAIPIFYIPGFFYGQHSNLAMAEYWRWWVVHLWVEGFFEVFATVTIAYLFTRMGLLKAATATTAVLFSTIVFLFGGIIGTFHHLYFTGTPTGVLALGATFSALEVVPLVLIGFEAYENLTHTRAAQWVYAYKWPIFCFIAVGFWNLVGAGLFGFLINPPIALYYMQGLNTTAVHAHTALFGVYGILGIGLMLFCLKGLATRHIWKTQWLAFGFWAINIGLALMVLLSDLPRGLMQTWASVEHGMWYARSAVFTQTEIMDVLRWLRVIGDTIFAIGVLALGWFVLGLKTGWSVTGQIEPVLDTDQIHT